MDDSWIEDGYPKGNNVKTGVSDVNGTNQAGVRASSYGTFGRENINKNSFGIVVKKYQQKTGQKQFLQQEGCFKDTNEDFALFQSLNDEMFKRLKASGLKKIKFPSDIAASGKAALPKRFAEWLQRRLEEEFGIKSEIVSSTKEGYSGFGLKLKSVEGSVAS